MAYKKSRIVANEERNLKIEQMYLPELKKYLCFKFNQNPKKCEGCPGIKTCRAGQRAVVLLNEMETERMKRNDGDSPYDWMVGKTRSEIRELTKKKFIYAMSQPDMIKYLMETDGSTRNCARERLKNWAKTYPDIAEQNDFKKKFDALALCHRTVLTGSGAEKKRIAMEKYAEAALQDDPIAFCMEKYGMDRAKAVKTYSQWKSRYGEIVKAKEDETVMEPVAETVVDEEISIEDFLKEVESPTQHTEKAAEEDEVLEKQDGGVEIMTNLLGELNAKFRELEKEKDRLKDRLAWIEKAQDALALTLNVFNPDSAIGKAVNGK